jgi:hypothetical protein
MKKLALVALVLILGGCAVYPAGYPYTYYPTQVTPVYTYTGPVFTSPPTYTYYYYGW